MDRRLQAFELLNQELAKEGLHLTLLCVGVMFWSITVCVLLMM